MRKEDELKTSFITPFGAYCYLRMPEGLKNAGGSFCRMTLAVVKGQLGRNILTYVDDIIVKSDKQEHHIEDLKETFQKFRKASLKLNPENCTAQDLFKCIQQPGEPLQTYFRRIIQCKA